MMRGYWLRFGPALVLASGLSISTAIAVLTSDSAWAVAAGPLLFALSLVGADAMGSRLRGGSSGPSREAVLLAAALLVACGMTALTEPTSLAIVIPILGGGAATPILLRSERRRNPCGGL
jgi:hypothetical protein